MSTYPRLSPNLRGASQTLLVDRLRNALPGNGTLLELESGAGDVAFQLAPLVRPLLWAATETTDAAVETLAARRRSAGPINLLPPFRLDSNAPDWAQKALAQLGVNPADISQALEQRRNSAKILPADTTTGYAALLAFGLLPLKRPGFLTELMINAARLLAPDGILLLYGPFRLNGVHTALENMMLEQALQEQDAKLEIPDLADLLELAEVHGLEHLDRLEMPEHSLAIFLRRRRIQPSPPRVRRAVMLTGHKFPK